MSKVIFKASKFLSDDEMNAEMYLTDIDTRSWVDDCNGKEVKMVHAWGGKVKTSFGSTCMVHIDWCEVLDDVEI